MPQIHLTTQQQEQFYAKVSKTPTERGCLEWLGTCNPNGYGYFGRHYYTHRVAWELANGPIPDGKSVLHHCDNRLCVNVDHLFLGTQADNMRDMDDKGRRSAPPRLKGEQNPKARLTAEQVLEIRSEKYAGWKQSDIARHFGITQVQAGRILNRESWAHLESEQDASRESGPAKGERVGGSKLTEQDVIAIRSDLYSQWTLVAIAERFGISKGQVWRILRREAWTHV